ncbi:AraC family transcriptional regulator [Pseudoalteromonas rubra]|uniref:AraC family transcriptional regulator n=1 Tax=Pseudoalteromonas rubra TaxID=43658 RepID=A0A5S3WLC0_9GAMM|nr:AraC family transcriptional regulator [Pseudoalteromonas rubra]TMP28486.1 AraC family transcriptional regulator [Pseudoalteromonas rubra]TMP30455.1 AraC family transcriptional regulator [Pseudoalteromonas rubra]
MATHNKIKKLNAGRDYIADRFQGPLCLSDIARSSYMSPYHFLRVFKDMYGETPNEFLVRLRIEQAKKMLITENFSVSEVCEQVGYASLGSFSSLFAKQVGMAPTSYRRKLWALSSEAYRFPAQVIPACYAYHFLGKLTK